MRILKTNPVLTILNSYLVDSPQPSTLSYLWNFGSLLGLSLVAQIITGIFLGMHYNGTAELGFQSVEHNHLDNVIEIKNKEQKKLIIKKLKKLKEEKKTKKLENNINDLGPEKFFDWFRGIVDAETCFHITLIKEDNDRPIFELIINIHKDDEDMLINIKNRLKIGSIYTGNHFSSYRVKSSEGLLKIFNFFDRVSLNTTKHLNYLALKKAYNIWKTYVNNKEKTIPRNEIIKEIKDIKQSMNNKRINFELPKDHKIIITPYWLLGLVEGDGYFSIHRNNLSPEFGITLTEVELKVLLEIKNFLLNYIINWQLYSNNENLIGITFENKKQYINSKPVFSLKIFSTNFIKTVLIPIFDNLNWMSKKKNDYEDWKKILILKSEGKEYIKEGRDIINLILSRMNQNRLFTKLIKAKLPNDLDKRRNNLLNAPSNLEKLENGKLLIKSLGISLKPGRPVSVNVINNTGIVINSFNTIKDCAQFFNMSMTSFCRKLDKGDPIIINNKSFFCTA